MKAQKKPAIIDYYPYAEGEHPKGLMNWMKGLGDNFHDHFEYTERNSNSLVVKTLEGTSYKVTSDDVIIRGVKGEYYPCKKDIFEETYTILTDDIQTTK